jgi:hypothetical protein
MVLRPLSAWWFGALWLGLSPAVAQAQGLSWELVPPEDVPPQSQSGSLSWELVPPGQQIDPAQDTAASEADAGLGPASARAADLGQPLHLGFALPTARLIGDGQSQLRFAQISADGQGQSAGTGNQNYMARFDFGLTERIMVSGFYATADDPLYNPIAGRNGPVGNLWEAAGAGLRVQLASSGAWQWAIDGSLEQFTVGSGCGGADNCSGAGGPNMFNASGSKVFTRNTVGSLALPLSWQASRQLALTFTPGVSLLPATQGSGQGGAGTFYGTNVFVGGGLSWRPIPELNLIGSAVLPLGPGANSFNSNLVFARVPVLTAGLNIAVNRRIALEGALTNGFGATPATALLTLPSANRMLLSAGLRWNPDEPDTPQGPLSRRQLSYAIGGLSVNTAWVPPSGTWQLSANGDSRGNGLGLVGWSASNIFQFDISGGVFNNVQPASALVNTYASNGGFNVRFGGKLVSFSQLRGAPWTGGGRISLGRTWNGANQGYLYAEFMQTWEANDWLALNLTPKLALSGISTPWGFGLSANLQLGQAFQLIPEANLVASDWGSSNGTLALRWLASPATYLDLYASSAAGLLDLGTLLPSAQVRVGLRLSVLL